MSDLAKRNEYGRRAEYQTESFLLDHFWVLKLSVDLDGAVFLVRPATRSAESLHQQAGSQSFVVVHSRAYGEGAEVEVPRLFVERPDRQPQTKCFLSVHAVDRSGAVSDYFFSAEEVQSVFSRKTNQRGQDVFAFAMTPERNFSQFQRNNGGRASMLSTAFAGIDMGGNDAFLKQMFETSDSAQPLLVQVSENQWQMRHRETLFEFERDENEIIHGRKSGPSGEQQLTPLLTSRPLDNYVFDPFNEEWIQRPQ